MVAVGVVVVVDMMTGSSSWSESISAKLDGRLSLHRTVVGKKAKSARTKFMALIMGRKVRCE